MQGFIFNKAQQVSKLLERKGERLKDLKWYEAEFVYKLNWDAKECRTVICGEEKILLSPNGCWFGWKQGKGFVVVPRRPSFKWFRFRPKKPPRIMPIEKQKDSFLRDEEKIAEMKGMIITMISKGETHVSIATRAGLSRYFINSIVNRSTWKGVMTSSYEAIKMAYDMKKEKYK